VNLHEDILKKVNNFFVNQPLDPRRGGSNPLAPPRPRRYFGLPMVNPGKPPLPPNRPYRQLLNYPKYVKDSNSSTHVKVFKATITTNSEINDVEIINMFSVTFRDIVYDWCNNYMGDYPGCTFVKL